MADSKMGASAKAYLLWFTILIKEKKWTTYNQLRVFDSYSAYWQLV